MNLINQAIVVTPLPPPDPARDHHGVYRRLRLFVQALASIAANVKIAHFVDLDSSAGRLRPDSYADYWGVPIGVVRLPLNRQRRAWFAKAKSVVDLGLRRDFRPYAGDAQKRALETLLKDEPDLVFAHRLPSMWTMRDIDISAPIVFDLDDVEHRVKLRAARQSRSIFGGVSRLVEVPALRQAERSAIARAASTFICSEDDRNYLIGIGHDADRLVVAHNAVDMPRSRPPLVSAPVVLCIGHYGYEPNAAAARELVTDIWPAVLARLPQARLIVAGAASEGIAALAAHDDSIEFPGIVPDLNALYARSRVVCCPIRVGGGTRIKLIEAAAFGKPIVATGIAAEGLGLEPDRDFLLRDSSAGLAEACVTALTDDVQAERLARGAREKVMRNHAVRSVLDSVEATLRGSLPGAERMFERATGGLG